MGFPEEEEEEKELRSLFKEIKSNTPRPGKEYIHQFQNTYRNAKDRNLKDHTIISHNKIIPR